MWLVLFQQARITAAVRGAVLPLSKNSPAGHNWPLAVCLVKNDIAGWPAQYKEAPFFNSPEKILIKTVPKTPGNGIAGRRGEF